jgi:hypothetical protein
MLERFSPSAAGLNVDRPREQFALPAVPVGARREVHLVERDGCAGESASLCRLVKDTAGRHRGMFRHPQVVTDDLMATIQHPILGRCRSVTESVKSLRTWARAVGGADHR